jgi:hypothetical protein
VDSNDRAETRFDVDGARITPRLIVKAILRPPPVDPSVAQALVAKYIPLEDR